MRKTFVNKLLLFLLLWPCFYSCGGHKSINGIVVSELLISVSKERHDINYCRLLREATNGDDVAINQLTLLDFYDGAGYDHGGVIVDLIKKVGEDKFIQSFREMDEAQKRLINGYIEVGLEYGNDSILQGSSLEEAFPKVYIFLNE